MRIMPSMSSPSGSSPHVRLLASVISGDGERLARFLHPRRDGVSNDKEIKMSQQYLGPYINFQGRAREAMDFYQKVLGGNLELQASNQQGAPKPAGPGDRITNARLEAEGAVIIGSDGHPDYPAKVGDNLGIALGGRDKERLTKLFNGLAEGGKVKMPPAEQSGGVGWLTDKFGINWTVSIEKA
jgi:PhnB protein